MMMNSEVYTILVPRCRVQTHRCVLEREPTRDNREAVSSCPAADGARHISGLVLIQTARGISRPQPHTKRRTGDKILNGVSLRRWCRYSMSSLVLDSEVSKLD